MPYNLLKKIKRGLRKPPHIIAKRLYQESRIQFERYYAPRYATKFNLKYLLQATNLPDLATLWQTLAKQPYPAVISANDCQQFSDRFPQASTTIVAKAELALAHKVDLLGTGLIDLGERIDWHRDYKTNVRWQPKFFADITICNFEDASDIKIPWEISRMQWLMPLGQAYLLTHDERYSQAAKDIIADWIVQNPYAYSVNWACTMEVALRIITWTWLFQVFNASPAWQDPAFQTQFLQSLFLHAEFTAKHLEQSDVNGNHYTADAAGLVVAGLFFNTSKTAQRWQQLGWHILTTEIELQVFADGVDYEASIAYHRLVLELFLLPALYRQAQQLPISEQYQQRLINMAYFTKAYSRCDGSTPLWGDADDARTLAFGDQALTDHRYLCGLVGHTFNDPTLQAIGTANANELFWWLGEAAATSSTSEQTIMPQSIAFEQGGFYIMQNDCDHVFIDCGPIGLAGRGGHGHNDCLAFAAMLDHELLISDCGAYVYTASPSDRNLFRSTAYHNTPQVDHAEINRFIDERHLWHLHYDAKPIVQHWETTQQHTIFIGSHTGYQRLPKPVTLKRTLKLDHQLHQLMIKDEFSGVGEHHLRIPLHLAPGVNINIIDNGIIELIKNHKPFRLQWHNVADWQMTIEPTRISPSYGIVVASQQLVWQRMGKLEQPLIINLSTKP